MSTGISRVVPRRGRKPFPASVFEGRRAYVAPLFAYMEAHNIMAQPVARAVSTRTGYPVAGSMLSGIKRGICVPPPMFIEEMCCELGRSVEEVMGRDWCEANHYPLVDQAEQQTA